MGFLTEARVLWVTSSILLGATTFFIKAWVVRVEKRIDMKVDSLMCSERHALVREYIEKLQKHRHAPVRDDGRGGEVILP
jgi:hypothetical protein